MERFEVGNSSPLAFSTNSRVRSDCDRIELGD